MDLTEETIDNGEVTEIVAAVKEIALSDTEENEDDLWTDIATSSSSNESFERPSIYKSYTFICTGELPEDEQCNEILLPRLVKASTLPKPEKLNLNKKDDDMNFDSDATELSSSDEGVEYRRVKGYPAMIRLIPALKAMKAIRKLRTWDTQHCMRAIREAGRTMSIKSCAQGSCPRPDKQSKFRIDGPFLRCSTNHFTTSSYGVDDSVDAIDEMEKRQKNHRNIRKPKKFPCPHVAKPRPCSFCRFWSFHHYTESEMYYADYLKDVTQRGFPPPLSSKPPTSAELAHWSSTPIEIGSSFAKLDLKVMEGSSGEKEKGSRLSRRPIAPAGAATPQTRGFSSASLPRLLDPPTHEKPLEKNSSVGPPRQLLPIRCNIKQRSPKIEPMVLPLPPVPALYENVPSRYMPPPIDSRKKLKCPDVLCSTTLPSRQNKQKRKPQLRPAFMIPGLRRSPKKKKTLRSARTLPAPRRGRTPRTPKLPQTRRGKKPSTPQNPKKSMASTPRKACQTVEVTDVATSNVKDIQIPAQPIESPLNPEQQATQLEQPIEILQPPAEPQIRQSGILQNPALAAARFHAQTPLLAEYLRSQEAESMKSSGPSGDRLPCLKLLPEYRPKPMTANVNTSQNCRNSASAPGTVQPLLPVTQSITQAALMAARMKLQRQPTFGRKTEVLMRVKPSIMTTNLHYLESRARPLERNKSPERLVLPRIAPRGRDAARAFPIPTKPVPVTSENVQEDPRIFVSKPSSISIGQGLIRSRTSGNKPFGSAKELLHDQVLDGPALGRLAKLKKPAKKATSFIR